MWSTLSTLTKQAMAGCRFLQSSARSRWWYAVCATNAGKSENYNNSAASSCSRRTIAEYVGPSASGNARKGNIRLRPALGQIDRLSSGLHFVVLSRFRAFSKMFRILVRPGTFDAHALRHYPEHSNAK